METRLKEHNAGRGAPYTSARLPIQLVYKEQFCARWQAERRELQLKNWSRQKKEALINRDLERLKELSKSRD
ncbi:MAG: GIY-YIG nuclease family protein [bacterium]